MQAKAPHAKGHQGLDGDDYRPFVLNVQGSLVMSCWDERNRHPPGPPRTRFSAQRVVDFLVTQLPEPLGSFQTSSC